MEQELRLTARGQAVCELMLDQGLTLEAACERVQFELEVLRETVARILVADPSQDVLTAVRAALAGVSLRLQSAYLEEEQRPVERGAPLSA